MTRHKTISNLSIAATTILFAAISGVAQTETNESNAATTSPAAITIIQPALAMNRELAPRRAAVSTATEKRASQPVLSAGMFKQSANQFSADAGQRFIASQKITFEPRAEITKNRADENSGPAPRPRITFVPSRGQKLPN